MKKPSVKPTFILDFNGYYYYCNNFHKENKKRVLELIDTYLNVKLNNLFNKSYNTIINKFINLAIKHNNKLYIKGKTYEIINNPNFIEILTSNKPKKTFFDLLKKYFIKNNYPEYDLLMNNILEIINNLFDNIWFKCNIGELHKEYCVTNENTFAVIRQNLFQKYGSNYEDGMKIFDDILSVKEQFKQLNCSKLDNRQNIINNVDKVIELNEKLNNLDYSKIFKYIMKNIFNPLISSDIHKNISNVNLFNNYIKGKKFTSSSKMSRLQ